MIINIKALQALKRDLKTFSPDTIKWVLGDSEKADVLLSHLFEEMVNERTRTKEVCQESVLVRRELVVYLDNVIARGGEHTHLKDLIEAAKFVAKHQFKQGAVALAEDCSTVISTLSEDQSIPIKKLQKALESGDFSEIENALREIPDPLI